LGEVDDKELQEKLWACQIFSVGSEFEKGRHRVSNCSMSGFIISLVTPKLDSMFKNLMCAAAVNLEIGLFVGNFLKMDHVGNFMLKN